MYNTLARDKTLSKLLKENCIYYCGYFLWSFVITNNCHPFICKYFESKKKYGTWINIMLHGALSLQNHLRIYTLFQYFRFQEIITALSK